MSYSASARPNQMNATISHCLSVIVDVLLSRFDLSKPPCTHSLWPNIVCAASNWIVAGIPALLVTWNHPYKGYITLVALVASTLYHLSEVKARLPGLPVIRNYARLLLQIDRLFALLSMWEVLHSMYLTGLNWPAVVVGIIGIACSGVSEQSTGWTFVIWHSIWHNAAFLALYLVNSN